MGIWNVRTRDGGRGSTDGYVAENAMLVGPNKKGGNLLTVKEYGDVIFRFEFRNLRIKELESRAP